MVLPSSRGHPLSFSNVCINMHIYTLKGINNNKNNKRIRMVPYMYDTQQQGINWNLK